MKSSKLLCILSALATALLVLSASVAAPILCRPFYYAHIAPLELTRYGLPAEEIRRAYGEMMDYCLGLRPDFAAGVLPASPEGAAHFADVRALFLLDLGVLVLSALVLAVLFAVGRRKKLIPAAPLGHGPGFWAAAGLAAVFLTVGGLAALDFQRAFVVFHTLFFPGKTNWLFDWRTDPIILFPPELRPADSDSAGILVRRAHRRRPVGGPPAAEAGRGSPLLRLSGLLRRKVTPSPQRKHTKM